MRNWCTDAHVMHKQYYFMISDFSDFSDEFPQILRTSLFLIVTERLSYLDFCAWWVASNYLTFIWSENELNFNVPSALVGTCQENHD